MSTDRLSRRLDSLGRLELAGLGVWIGGALGLQVVLLVAGWQDQPEPSSTAWLAGAITGVLAAAGVMTLFFFQWRKHGGRRLHRLGRATWLTGRLPDDLPTRMAVLRDLERREQALQRAWLPMWIVTLCWTVLIAANVITDHEAWEVAASIALWSVFLASGALDLVDRRMRPRLGRLIAELRRDPVPAVARSS